MNTKIQEPKVLTAKCYFWSPGGAASQRRNAEKARLGEVAEFFGEIGMTVTEHTDGHVIANRDGVVARFDYSESCHNVYKTLEITRNGKRSNITALRKFFTD